MQDVIAPKIKSVADRNNYGDEYGAKDIVNPEPYAYEGIGEKDFLLIRQAEEIRSLSHQQHRRKKFWLILGV